MPLTARKVETAKPGRHSDGGGLTLLVQPSGRKSWVLRVQVKGKRRDRGLGAYPAVSLGEAREKARHVRKGIKAGEDVRAKPAECLTFKQAAEQLIDLRRPGWRNAKHAAQWPSTLETYAYPVLGARDARAVSTDDVLGVLAPIWTTKPETASRVRQRIEAVLDHAAAVGGREGANPARWRGHLANLLPSPTEVRPVHRHAALDWRRAPAFWGLLQARDGLAAKALAFAILTATRSGEARGLRWDELDLDDAVWTVPASRSRSGREHRVPLTRQALALLEDMDKTDALVFPSPRNGDLMLSDMALTAVLRRMRWGELTVHGFRSTFRDWADEATGHPHEVIEAALAHRPKDRAGHARGHHLVTRRRLMEDWAAYLGSAPPARQLLRGHDRQPAEVAAG